MDSGVSVLTPGHYVDEAQLLSFTIAKDSILGNDEGSLPEEAVVRLPTTAQPDSRIKIDGQMSDLHVARTEEDEDRIAHQMFGHISHRKMAATSAVVDSFPKYSKHC